MSDLIARLRSTAEALTFAADNPDFPAAYLNPAWDYADEAEAAAARIAELEAEVARLREAFVWCADAPMCATLEALGEDVEAACLAWDARQPADYNQTLDDARSTLRALTGGDDRE